MRRVIGILLIAIASILLCACSNTAVQKKPNSDNPEHISITENIISSYTDDMLSNIILHNGTMDALLAEYPTKYVRQMDNCYRVVYYGDSAIAVVWFDLDGNSPVSQIYKATQPKSTFDNLSIGQSLNEVISVDPDGEYLFLYTGRNDFPKISTHYTSDGYVVNISYDDDHLITQIIIEQT